VRECCDVESARQIVLNKFAVWGRGQPTAWVMGTPVNAPEPTGEMILIGETGAHCDFS
jgi:hypothetical protein